MSLGHYFFIGIPGPKLDRASEKLLKLIQPSGIILFGRNVRSAKQLAILTHRLRKLLGSKLLICLDHEGGRVNRLKDIVGAVPSAMQLGYLGREDLAKQHGKLTGRLLCEVGVNINLAPVLDLWLRPKVDNSVPDRCWSRKPKEVVRLAGAFLYGMQKEGVIGCGKHFLGYGAADKDPHLLLPRVNRTRTQILKEDLLPYSALLPKNHHSKSRALHMIMLSHAHLRAFHGNRLTPASVSQKISFDLLRTQLGFDGITITDDLEMGAITRMMSISQATIRCIELGTDLILICHTPKIMREAFLASQKAFKKGAFNSQIESQSIRRIEKLKSLLEPSVPFSEKRFNSLVKEIHEFTHKVFKALPPSLQVIDPRWGAIGEKY